jgi:hypothetical protein
MAKGLHFKGCNGKHTLDYAAQSHGKGRPLCDCQVLESIHLVTEEKISVRQIGFRIEIDPARIVAALRPLGYEFPKAKLTEELKDRICFLYKFLRSSEILARMFGVSGTTVLKCFHERGVVLHPSNDLTSAEREQMFAASDLGVSALELGRRFQRDRNTVVLELKKSGRVIRGHRGLAHRVHTLDAAAFDRGDEGSQYWLGFLMADGCVYETGTVSLALAHLDKPHLVKFKAFLGSDATIHEYEGNRTSYKPKKIFSKLCVHSKDLTDTLAVRGVIPRKTGKEKFLMFEQSRHVWRGAIDGDGSLGVRKAGALWLTLSGSKDLCDQFRAFVLTLTPTRAKVRDAKRSIHTFGVSGSIAQAVITELYRDSTIFLDRKHARILHLLKQK